MFEKSATFPACSGKGVIKGAKIVIRITIETIIKPIIEKGFFLNLNQKISILSNINLILPLD